MNFAKLLLFVLIISAFITGNASAHCDQEDGPVITAAKKALEENNVNLILIWVQKKDEQQIKQVFDKTVAVRKLGQDAKEMADKYFFDTLVRIHRSGEGAPFTGVKPAGFNTDPSVMEADKSLEKGSLKNLYTLISDEVHNGLHQAYDKVESLKNYDKNDVEAGREYVEAYVKFLHYAEGVYNAAKSSGEHHEHSESIGEL